ncbi:multiple epidermal growth factor-like domains protein 10 [Mercenaria mercenaria]|uniref:multiple epidermal growth factor-like domains protein 10 n=1 Tax=Mercenaria mercenaria TaxID=6596 RepID=UPI00234E4C02|nr:multiple epidermal growth factor-like domains protein 10 [Mercenaria mercenaria]
MGNNTEENNYLDNESRMESGASHSDQSIETDDMDTQSLSNESENNQKTQFENYTLSVGNSSELTKEIFQDDGVGNATHGYQPKETQLQNVERGQFLKVERKLHEDGLLAICEVHVFADCLVNKCGWNCSLPCYCQGDVTGTVKIDGLCPSGCLSGWTGNGGKCDIGCWGDECENECGNCLEQPCNTGNGECSGGCNGPWYPPLCILGCDSNTYGINCSNSCGNCRNDVRCDIITGVCPDGCDDGWHLANCKTECANGTYGLNCSGRCGYCFGGGTCDHVTGYCPDRCAAGYVGNMCIDECSNGTYGLNCSNRCGYCLNNVACNPVSGICETGCQEGWRGDTCVEAIGDGSQHEAQGPSFAVGVIVGVISALGVVGLAGALRWIIILQRRKTKKTEQNVYSSPSYGCNGTSPYSPNYDVLDHSHTNQDLGIYYNSEVYIHQSENDTG